MQKLLEYIDENSLDNTKELQECISSMICSKEMPVPLLEDDLRNALKLNGEFSVLKLNYNDYENELRNQIIKYKISQSLSVIVSYEDDGNSFQRIEKFVEYISSSSDTKQNSIFGVKKVNNLSEFPIKILFSGILSINQLKMTVGKKIDELIHSNDEYFLPRFQEFRDKISKEINISILPILPMLDITIKDYQVKLVDLHDGRLISDFEVDENFTKNTIEVSLLKLFYVYKALAQQNSFNAKEN